MSWKSSVPSEEIKAKTLAVMADMARSVRTYLVWRTIINFGLAILVGLVYQFAGLKQAWTWAGAFGHPQLHPLSRTVDRRRVSVH